MEEENKRILQFAIQQQEREESRYGENAVQRSILADRDYHRRPKYDFQEQEETLQNPESEEEATLNSYGNSMARSRDQASYENNYEDGSEMNSYLGSRYQNKEPTFESDNSRDENLERRDHLSDRDLITRLLDMLKGQDKGRFQERRPTDEYEKQGDTRNYFSTSSPEYPLSGRSSFPEPGQSYQSQMYQENPQQQTNNLLERVISELQKSNDPYYPRQEQAPIFPQMNQMSFQNPAMFSNVPSLPIAANGNNLFFHLL